MAGRDGKVSTRPATTHRETAAKGDNNLCCIRQRLRIDTYLR